MFIFIFLVLLSLLTNLFLILFIYLYLYIFILQLLKTWNSNHLWFPHVSFSCVFNFCLNLYLSTRIQKGAGNPIQMRHKRSMALKRADVVVLMGVPADFRVDYGKFFFFFFFFLLLLLLLLLLFLFFYFFYFFIFFIFFFLHFFAF